MPAVKRPRAAGKRARKTARKAWSRSVEAASLALDAAKHTEARRAFENLARADQLCLAYELAYTRRRELTLAYENVISVTSGLKHSRSRGGRVRAGGPCVVFVVRSKWKKNATRRRSSRQHIPPYLLSFWGSGESRRLCAVPTDVVHEHGFYSTRTQALSGVRVKRGNSVFIGNIACVVRVTRPGGATADMLLSALHVFSPLPEVNTEPPRSGTAIDTLADLGVPTIGTAAAFGGALWWTSGAGEPRHSFDAQLAAIQDIPAMMQALEGYALSATRPYVRTLQEIYALADRQLRILVSPFNPLRSGSGPRDVRARYSNDHPPEAGWEYDVSVGGARTRKMIHPGWLVDLRLLAEITADGDSGSPVVVETENDGFTLVGMHIARSDRSEGSFSVIVPAWQLFEADRYKRRLSAMQPISPELAGT